MRHCVPFVNIIARLHAELSRGFTVLGDVGRSIQFLSVVAFLLMVMMEGPQNVRSCSLEHGPTLPQPEISERKKFEYFELRRTGLEIGITLGASETKRPRSGETDIKPVCSRNTVCYGERSK